MKKRIFNGISAVGALLFLAAMFKIKGDYYQLRYAHKWLKDDFISIAWVVCSFAYSSLPMLCLVVGNVWNMIKRRTENSAPNFSMAIVMSMCFCLANLVFEIVSLGGAGMTLDDTWMDIVFKMLNYHGLSMLLVIVNLLVEGINYRKEKKRMN